MGILTLGMNWLACLLIIITISCSHISSEDENSLPKNIEIENLIAKVPETVITKSYTQQLNEIDSIKTIFKKKYSSVNSKEKKEILDSISLFFTERMIENIFPYWYGTPWDFNGHTNMPNEGEVACGYFVSTTLKHFGFNLNRYKLAQQSAMNEAKTLQPIKPLVIYRNKSISIVIQSIKKDFDDGLYILGLDNHVGYLWKNSANVFFIHSNYIDNMVVKKIAETSPCFSSSIHVIGSLSNNKELMEKWVLRSFIPVVMD